MTTSSDRRVDGQLTPRQEPSEEKPTKTPRYAPLLSWIRFGPGSIAILLLIAFITVEHVVLGFVYFAVISGAISILLFGVKSMEIIQIGHPEGKKLIGQRCVVVKEVGKGKMGVVRVYDRNGRLDPQFWSAESEHEIPEGQEAEVAGMRSIVLLIKP